MAKVQKVYTREFKEQAVQLAQTSGKSIAQVERLAGHLRHVHSPMAQGTGSARQRSLSRQRTPNAIRVGKPPRSPASSKESSRSAIY